MSSEEVLSVAPEERYHDMRAPKILPQSKDAGTVTSWEEE